jgi:hypothetical protein
LLGKHWGFGTGSDSLTAALDIQKPLVNDLCGQGAQMALTLKLTLTLEHFLRDFSKWQIFRFFSGLATF